MIRNVHRASSLSGTVRLPGDRTGRLVDPFGHLWALAQHVKDLTPEEMKEAQEAFFRQAQPA